MPFESWFPVLTLLLGFVAKAISDHLQHSRTLSRERESRIELRRERITDQRIAFQRETLLGLQDVVQALVRTTFEINHSDILANNQSGEPWRLGLVGEDLSTRHHTSQVEIHKLSVRARDERIRELAAQLSSECGQVVFAKSADASNTIVRRAMLIGQELGERLGTVLRSLDDTESAELTRGEERQ